MRKNPRRGTSKVVPYPEENDGVDDRMEVDGEIADSFDADDEAQVGGRRRSSRTKKNIQNDNENDTSKENLEVASGRRTSSRATKFKSSMKELSDTAFGDLLNDTKMDNNATIRRKPSCNDEMSESEDGSPQNLQRVSKRSNPTQAQKQKKQMDSPLKSPARRHKQHHRLSIGHHPAENSDSEESSGSSAEAEGDDEGEEEPFKIQRIIASRTEPRNVWARICAKMNTFEIDDGSRWLQDPVNKDDTTFEERFLVKWSDHSYLHVSWETENDLTNLLEKGKNYLSTFFRKSEHGLLFSSDERCDGDYFDPAWTQVDRILEVTHPPECPLRSVKNEDNVTNEELGIVLDKNSEDFEKGSGREFLIKWGNNSYSEVTYEFERDLILNEVDYKEQLKEFCRRKKKVSLFSGQQPGIFVHCEILTRALRLRAVVDQRTAEEKQEGRGDQVSFALQIGFR